MSAVPQGVWRISAERSRIGFKVRKMGLYFVKGTFKRVNGTVEVGAEGAPVGGWLRIDASSVSTRVPPRDWHLRTRDFLAVREHPEIRIAVERVEHAGGGAMLVPALVTVRGVEAQVPLTAHWHPSEGADLGTAVLHVAGTVDRRELGVRPRRPVDWIVGRELYLDAVLHLKPAW
ncbi:MAG: YceI family protein [Thermoleophilaceae bacterium]|nr:YceI family protein [Thermoleophilaceae bacterium]